MSISTKDYFDRLQEWLNREHYISAGNKCAPPKGKTGKNWGEVVLAETLPNASGRKAQIGQQVNLYYKGEVFVVELDRNDPKANRQNLFHFLNNTGPWTKRCDFAVFHYFKNKINVHCIEFKREKVDQNHISDQLNRGRDWVASMQAALHFYEKEKKPFHISIFVFTSNKKPRGFVNSSGFLRTDAKVRLWRYADANGTALQDLGGCPEVLR